VRFTKVTYLEVLQRNLQVMDSTAIALCRDNKLPVIVFNLYQRGNIGRVIAGDLTIGTRVE
jgi:uridylate kinase